MLATIVAVPSGSYRHMFATSTRNSRPASSATAANASSGGAPAATSVATLRNAACCSASRASEARLSVFAIAVATSSVNEARRVSVSAGSRGSWPMNAMTMQPHSWLSTLTGTPIDERSPHSRDAT